VPSSAGFDGQEKSYNEFTRRTALVLIKNNQRIFGADNTGGWHLHPFADPSRHDSMNAPMTGERFHFSANADYP
jgi:hypothetical protein